MGVSLTIPGSEGPGGPLILPLPPVTAERAFVAIVTDFAGPDLAREALEEALTAEHVAAARAEPAPETVAPVAEPPPVAEAPAPRAAPNGVATWERRAVAAPVLPGRPMLAIVLDDMGLERGRAERAAALPAPLTFAFLPYGRDAPALARMARLRGHEIILHMPMQPVGGQDPGPDALTLDLAPADIRARVGAALDRFEAAIGLNNHMGSRFTAERRLLATVMDELAQRGLVFVDSRTSAASHGLAAARAAGVPAAGRDIFLDNEVTLEAVRRQLDEAERIARRHGAAVAIGHPHEATLAALASWLESASERGLQLVPVSAVIRWTEAHATLAAAR